MSNKRTMQIALEMGLIQDQDKIITKKVKKNDPQEKVDRTKLPIDERGTNADWRNFGDYIANIRGNRTP